jgi:hypothetical protein
MERPADEGTVVQTVPMLRVQAVIFTLLALVALAVTAVLAKTRSTPSSPPSSGP